MPVNDEVLPLSAHTIPLEIVAHIFTFVTKRELVVLSTVNRAFQIEAERLLYRSLKYVSPWSRLNLQRNRDHLLSMISAQRRSRPLYVQEFFLRIRIALRPNLGLFRGAEIRLVAAFLSKALNLRVLNIVDFSSKFESVLPPNPGFQLESLTIAPPPTDRFAQFLSHQTSIRMLHLTAHPDPSYEDLCAVTLPSVTTLSCVTRPQLHAMMQAQCTLKALNYHEKIGSEEEALDLLTTLEKHCNSLNEILLRFPPSETACDILSFTFCALARAYKFLHKATFLWTPVHNGSTEPRLPTSTEWINALASMTRLKGLELHWGSSSRQRVWQELDFRDNSPLWDILKTWMAACPSLQSIYLCIIQEPWGLRRDGDGWQYLKPEGF